MDVLTWRRVLEKNPHSLIAIRHGETQFNVEGRCATTSEVPLTDKGREEALYAAPSLTGVSVDAVFSSPRLRAQETGRLIMPELAGEIQVDERLREPPAGPFEGEVFSELWGSEHPLSSQFADYMDEENPIAPKGAEPIEETTGVAQSLLDELGRTPGRYVVFSHGGLLRIMACLFAGADPRYAHRLKLDNCHAIALKWYPDPPHQVLAINLPPRALPG